MKFDETLMSFVQKDLKNGNIPMLVGEAGIGKSSWVEALAKLMHTKAFTLACNQLADKADLTGARLVPVTVQVRQKDGTFKEESSYKQVFYPHAVLHDAIEYANNNPRETPILFLDELNRSTPDITSEALSIPTMRSIGSAKLPDNLKVITAGNDKGNITTLDEASISRFVLYRVEPDISTFLAVNPDLNPFVKKTLQAHPECLFGKTLVLASADGNDDDDDNDIDMILGDTDSMSQFTTPRTITGASKFLNEFSNQELMAALANTTSVNGTTISALQEALEGHIGYTQFMLYLVQEIANNVMTTSNQANTVQIGKPSCYDMLKQQPDRTALQNYINNMTDAEKSGCLVYMLYERLDNSVYIDALAPAITRMENTDVQTLMTCATSGNLDSQNTHAFLGTHSTIANTLSVILESI